MTSKHTPGPWKVELAGLDGDYGFIVERATVRADWGLVIAEVEPHDLSVADVNVQHLARLAQLGEEPRRGAGGKSYPAGEYLDKVHAIDQVIKEAAP